MIIYLKFAYDYDGRSKSVPKVSGDLNENPLSLQDRR